MDKDKKGLLSHLDPNGRPQSLLQPPAWSVIMSRASVYPYSINRTWSWYYALIIFFIWNTPQIAYRVTAYRVDSAYRVGFTWNQIILGIYIVRADLIQGRYSVACRVDWNTKLMPDFGPLRRKWRPILFGPLWGRLIAINQRVTNNVVWERKREREKDW